MHIATVAVLVVVSLALWGRLRLSMPSYLRGHLHYDGAVDQLDETPPRERSKEVTTLSDLVRLAEELDSGSNRVWYRGHANADYTLTPSLLRKRPIGSKQLDGTLDQIESSLCDQFLSRARLWLPTTPVHAFEELALMRHYGLPTRLLDWSMSLLPPTFFAVEEQKPEAPEEEPDGMIWVFDVDAFLQHPRPYWKEAWGPKPEQITGRYADEHMASVKALKQHGHQFPLHLWLPPYFDPRLHAQQCTFTVHPITQGQPARSPTDVAPLEEVAAPFLTAIRIAADSKREIRRGLATLGITRERLFPDLPTLAQSLVENLPG